MCPRFGILHCAEKDVKQAEMAAECPLKAMRQHGIECAKEVEKLAWVFFHPEPRSQLECERQEYAVRYTFTVAQIQIVPNVTVRDVAERLRLDDIHVIGQRA